MNQKNKLLIWEICAVGFLLSAFFLTAFSSMLMKSPTFDEPVFITGGANAWRNNDYRINPEGCALPGRWVSLPAALSPGVKFPAVKDFSCQDQWFLSWLFIYNFGNNSDFIFLSARLMTLFAGLLLGWLVFHISRHYFGPLGALISLCLYSFSPTMIAHSRLAVSDLITALTFLFATWTVWLALQKMSLWRVLSAAIALVLLFICKMSAFLFVPMFALMFFFRLFAGGPLPVRLPKLRERAFTSRGKQFWILTSLALFFAFFVYLGIWTAYGFRYSMLADQQKNKALMENSWKALEAPGIVCDSVKFARKFKLLPEAFLYGFAYTYNNSKYRFAFLNGAYRGRGWAGFFPYAFLVKTPLPFLGLLAFLIVAWILWFEGVKKKSGLDFRFSLIFDAFYKYAPLWILIFIYSLFAVASSLNIGHRHIIVVYPPLFILAGSVSTLMAVFSKRYFNNAIFLLLALYIIDSLSIWPDYLAYFNVFAGGPDNAHKHLVDSSLDWGQDAQALQRRLKAEDLKKNDVYLSFFGSMPYREFGIKARKLPCFFEQRQDEIFPLGGGVYCISATMLRLIPYPALPKWDKQDEVKFKACRREMQTFFRSASNPEKLKKLTDEKGAEYFRNVYKVYELLRFAKLCQYLKDRKPDDNVGHSILIYNLTDDDIRKALSGN